MTTESDAVLATIVDNWGGGGYGGATPKIQSTADISVDRWAALDAVIVLHDTLDELHDPINDKFVDKIYTMDIRVTSITSEDQLKLLVEETEYLLNNTAVTGFTSCRVSRKWRGSSDRGRKVYRNDITITLKVNMSSSPIAPSGGVTTTFETDELTVNTSIVGTPTAALGNTAITGTLSTSGVTTFGDESITSAQIADLLMFGSANAALVPCSIDHWNPVAKGDFTNVGEWTNVDNTTCYITYLCPLPTNKTGLKLYISGTRISLSDADANDFITNTIVEGLTTVGRATIDADPTDKKTVAQHTDTFTPVDASPYFAVQTRLQTLNTNAGDLKIQYVLLQCYYAT